MLDIELLDQQATDCFYGLAEYVALTAPMPLLKSMLKYEITANVDFLADKIMHGQYNERVLDLYTVYLRMEDLAPALLRGLDIVELYFSRN